MNRRLFLGALAGLVAAPHVIRASGVLMPVKPLPPATVDLRLVSLIRLKRVEIDLRAFEYNLLRTIAKAAGLTFEEVSRQYHNHIDTTHPYRVSERLIQKEFQTCSMPP